MTLMIDAFDDQQVVQGDPINPVNSSNLTTNNVPSLAVNETYLFNILSGPAEAILHAHPFGLNEVLTV